MLVDSSVVIRFNSAMMILKKARREVLRFFFKPRIPTTKKVQNLKKIGTLYGGWVFLDHPSLNKSVIISAGAGEDISFDVGFAREYESKIIIVDPTPRAIVHVEGVLNRIRNSIPTDARFNDTGQQDIGAYNLEGLTENQLCLERVALWNKREKLKFFLPRNPLHVSHSIVNYQGSNDFIEVESITLDDILSKYQIRGLSLIKLDIEGAEIEVIHNLFEKNIFPLQILVEFDEMRAPNRNSKARVESCYNQIIKNGYDLVYFDGSANCLFLRNEISVV
jgi:FkbM family methyltransferase